MSSEEVGRLVDHLFREWAGQMVAVLTRIFGPQHIDMAEDVVQEAMLQALRSWPFHGVPANPRAWLIQVARNRGLDVLRRNAHMTHALPESADFTEPSAEVFDDDQLKLMLLCCHPALTRESSIALTLKTAAGLSVAEIARAFLTDPTAIAQRIVRAKRTIREAGMSFELPSGEALNARVDVALDVLYLSFNEGHTSQAGDALVRTELASDALRLALLLTRHPATAQPRVHALCALLALTAARLPARVNQHGELVLLHEQDRSKWDGRLVALGFRQLELAASGNEVSRYHIEAEIASCHAMTRDGAGTDWTRIAWLYHRLYELTPTPVVALNRAVALGMAEGPEAALTALQTLRDNAQLDGYYPFHAVRAEFLRRAGRSSEAADALRAALALHPVEPVRRHLVTSLQAVSSSL